MTPEVSVIVVNWNRRDMLRGSLESLQRQEGPTHEIIVVDNGSTDGSVDMIAELRFSVSLIQNSENRGFCAANNQGILAAKGQYIALLNNDAEAQPGWLASCVQAMEQSPDVGMVASKVVFFDEPGRIDKAGHLIYPDGQNRGRGTGEWDNGQYDREEEALWPDGCAALYRKSMLDEIGGFDEDLFAYGDDAELGLRARLAGWRCIYTPRAVVRHRRSATLGVMSARRVMLIERNRILLAVKHFPLRLLLLNPFYFGLRLLAGLAAAFTGRGEAGRFRTLSDKLRLAGGMLHGIAAGVAMTPRTWRKRRNMIRRITDEELVSLLFRYRISLHALSEGAG